MEQDANLMRNAYHSIVLIISVNHRVKRMVHAKTIMTVKKLRYAHLTLQHLLVFVSVEKIVLQEILEMNVFKILIADKISVLFVDSMEQDPMVELGLEHAKESRVRYVIFHLL